ncbi:hypothetical protein ACJQWK_08308 [Exserohilum turcicum]|uniref:Uncharacterized protein n=1 Tax=Exserohilum turcicum (strain 28A) TaxID=671987 RepID=R0KFC7_EXST2|nr:uncharacterized protein SETTUDRAFT_31130 [Exserohilum turcica Et28A]EOA86812.1 hypothetical protein SETTUDRAFT_31130 [Exserohilum turcica Et28A]
MAPATVAAGNDRKFNWDDDDEDDFDLDTWKATVDTSLPSVEDLGPLQLFPREEPDKAGEEDDDADCADPDLTYWSDADTLSINDMDANEWPIVAADGAHYSSSPEGDDQAPFENAYMTMVNYILEEQIASARHEYLIHAIGPYYDGKEEADAPAYPELSSYGDQRYRYARAFRAEKYANGKRNAEVYRHSPLVVVTAIEEAHLMDEEKKRNEERQEEVLVHVDIDHDPEEVDFQAPVFNISRQEAGRDANAHVKLDKLPAHEHFSKDELAELIKMWKTQQEEDGEDSDDEDATSIDSWEKSDTPDDVDSSAMLPSVRQPEASRYNEELDFNDVVFSGDYEHATPDEGYISSSPPVSPLMDDYIDECDWQTQSTEASVRPKPAARVDSMDALDELGAASAHHPAIDDLDEDGDSVEMMPTNREYGKSNNGPRAPLIYNTQSVAHSDDSDSKTENTRVYQTLVPK